MAKEWIRLLADLVSVEEEAMAAAVAELAAQGYVRRVGNAHLFADLPKPADAGRVALNAASERIRARNAPMPAPVPLRQPPRVKAQRRVASWRPSRSERVDVVLAKQREAVVRDDDWEERSVPGQS
ncbi:hypothetical protein ETD86_45805 [Nonomuraea turkmeniaca]|uniref:Uncharacterized protein n=1 Tax=Nonomuraea turkmeniaca TaxID=103838 RepID=A0A5S4EYT2_9ACTN|nr:hypothetical protein [Nonomuraea turkmeniaca]TMR08891.1 hypothetical protein ETD86_45805 [Nonomuraea turkmeniaca]